MKIGKRVTYEIKGTRHAATVMAIAGTGESGRKTLDLSYDGGTAENVPHGVDREKGEGFWLLETETETPPERRAPLSQQPMALAEAQGSGLLPDSDRRSEEPVARRKVAK